MIDPTSVTLTSRHTYHSWLGASTGGGCVLCGVPAEDTCYYRPREWRAWPVGRLELCGDCAAGVAHNPFWLVLRVIRTADATHVPDHEKGDRP